MAKNIFIEGIQGSGKTTLLRKMSGLHPEYNVYYEGDISPVELAWCSYMEKDDFERMLMEYAYVKDEILKYTQTEGHRYITAYTRVLAEKREFYERMESFEIYNGRVQFAQFRDIIMMRYRKFAERFVKGDEGAGNLFECSFFQNSIESMMLYYQMPEEEIIDFYRAAFEILKEADVQMFYLDSDNIRDNILQIKKERTDNQGNELWYPLMQAYLNESPYGKAHGYQDLKDMMAHFERRHTLEKRIMKEVLGNTCKVLKAKEYRDEELV